VGSGVGIDVGIGVGSGVGGMVNATACTSWLGATVTAGADVTAGCSPASVSCAFLAQAKAKGIDVAVAEFQFRELGKAQAMGELPGVFKLIADKADGKLLGAHFAGAHATDLISEAALALQMGASAADIAGTIHAHPTLAEGMMEAAAMIGE
jgi:hypothetical protein